MRSRVEHERHLLRSALALLDAGEARRVTIVGLGNGEQLLTEMMPVARSGGMVLRAIRGRGRCDLAVEPVA